MRFTPAKLRRIAEQLTEVRRRDLNLLAAYLTGSLVEGDPFLGGVADVDLVFIYNDAPPEAYLCKPWHETVYVEIWAYGREAFEPPRRLRTDPLWGPALFHAQPLYDPQHFLDFVQSAVRSRFRDPEVALRRGLNALEQARQVWEALDAPWSLAVARDYLRLVLYSANVVATLVGRWLPPRRLMSRLGEVAQRLGHPEWVAEVFRLMGAPQVEGAALSALLAQAQEAAQALSGEAAVRARYYLRAAQALAHSEVPNQALFPLLWWLVEARMEETAREVFAAVGLDDIAHMRQMGDAWLDRLEEFLEHWGRQQGVWPLE